MTVQIPDVGSSSLLQVDLSLGKGPRELEVLEQTSPLSPSHCHILEGAFPLL